MIVVDTNTIIYFYVPSPRQHTIEKLFMLDSHWVAPPLWKSEFRSALSAYIRAGYFSMDNALVFMNRAEEFMSGYERAVSSTNVLRLINQSSCSAYDCEFVALAMELNVKLITHDKEILTEFPMTSMTSDQYITTFSE